MNTFEYIMSQDRLSTYDCFTLCDEHSEGFPIMYASQGFVDLFGYTASECIGIKCGCLVGKPSILRHDPRYDMLARLTCMAPEEVAQSMDVLTAHAARKIDQMVANPARTVVVQLLNRTKGGELIVCEVAMFARRSPLFGYFYVGLQHDVTSTLPAVELLHAGLHGKHIALIKSRQKGMKQRLSIMKVNSGMTSRYLHEKAGEMWLNCISRALEAEEGRSTSGSGPLPVRGRRQLSGCWRGTVSDALGGYEQVMEFSGARLRVWTLGRMFLGSFRLDDGREPHHLDMWLQTPAEEAPPSGMPAPAPIPCVVKVEADVLHLCRPYPTSDRPRDFDSPGYCMMHRDRPRRK